MRPTREERLAQTQKRIRRTYRLEILLPLVLGFTGLLVLTLIAAFVPRTNLSANLLVTVLMICPMVILTFMLVLILVAGVYGMGRLNHIIHSPMRKAEELTITAHDKVVDTSDVINQQAANFGAKTAPLEMWLNNAFNRKKKREELL